MKKLKLILEEAQKDHIAEICDLVNFAYRGGAGWTKETDIVGGDRTTVDEVEKYIEDESSHLLVALVNGMVMACICIESNQGSAYIGYFAVHPSIQANGIGKDILSQAEEYASTKLGAKKYIMVVISQRNELISYYERRGYERTGEIKEYPIHLNVGVPLESDLTIEYLVKHR